jgi:hypothetical protein
VRRKEEEGRGKKQTLMQASRRPSTQGWVFLPTEEAKGIIMNKNKRK